MQEVSDDRLLAIASLIGSNRKNDDAWSEFAIRIWPTVFIATKRLNMVMDPKEVHAEVMVRMFRHAKLENFSTESGIRAYLWVVIRTIAANQKSAAPPHTSYLDEASPAGAAATQPTDRAILGELICSLKHHLEADELELLDLLTTTNTSRKTMAAQLHITEGYLASQISRLKARIQNLIEKKL